MKELAEGAFGGREDLREAAMSEACSDDLGQAFGRFWSHYQELGQDERDKLIQATEEALDGLLDGPASAASTPTR